MLNLCKAAAVLVFVSCLHAEPISRDAKRTIEIAEKQWQQAVLDANQSALTNLMADDITYTHSSSLTQSRKEFIDSVVSGATKYQSIDFKTNQMRQYGNTVVVIHDAVITTAQTGVAHLYITHVWCRQNGRWEMVSRQATKIAEPPK